jgi:hypothetical protein
MTNSKNHQQKEGQTGPSKQHGSDKHDGNSSSNDKNSQKHTAGKSSSKAGDEDELETNNDITDDPEGTKKKIPQMKK